MVRSQHPGWGVDLQSKRKGDNCRQLPPIMVQWQMANLKKAIILEGAIFHHCMFNGGRIKASPNGYNQSLIFSQSLLLGEKKSRWVILKKMILTFGTFWASFLPFLQHQLQLGKYLIFWPPTTTTTTTTTTRVQVLFFPSKSLITFHHQ